MQNLLKKTWFLFLYSSVCSYSNSYICYSPVSLDLFWKGGYREGREPAHQQMILYLPSHILVSSGLGWQWLTGWGDSLHKRKIRQICGENSNVFKPQHLVRRAQSLLNYGLYSHHAASFSLSSQFPDRDLLAWCQNQPLQLNSRIGRWVMSYRVCRASGASLKCFWLHGQVGRLCAMLFYTHADKAVLGACEWPPRCQCGWEDRLCPSPLAVFKLEAWLPYTPSDGLCFSTDTAAASARLCAQCRSSSLVPWTAQDKFKPAYICNGLLTHAHSSLVCVFFLSYSYTGRSEGEALPASRALDSHRSMQLEQHI